MEDEKNPSASDKNIANTVADETDKTAQANEAGNENAENKQNDVDSDNPEANAEMEISNNSDTASDEENAENNENSEDIEKGENEDTEPTTGHFKDSSVKKKKKRRKKGHGRFIFGLVFATLIITISILCAVFILKYSKEFLGIDKSSAEVVIEIPTNSSTEDIANQLYSEGIITNTYLFRLFSRVKGSDGTYIAGSHTLSPNMSYSDMVEELQKGAVDERESVNVVFPEGIRLYDAAQLLDDKGVCGRDEFIRAFNSSDFGFDFEKNVKVSSLKFYKMEGYFFPDTYTFYLDEDARIVAKKIYKNFEAKITPDYYGRMTDLNMDLEKTLTLASMVQAEGQSKSDMKKIASVFYNRLADPDNYPLLQSDPTKKYVDEVIKPYIEFPSQQMFKAYNTYEGAGLPPGPICNPGLDAIEAVLYPDETDYYYFCANVNTGEVFYAATLEEHEQNLILAGLA